MFVAPERIVERVRHHAVSHLRLHGYTVEQAKIMVGKIGDKAILAKLQKFWKRWSPLILMILQTVAIMLPFLMAGEKPLGQIPSIEESHRLLDEVDELTPKGYLMALPSLEYVPWVINHVIHLLETGGASLKDLVLNGILFLNGVSGRDLTSIIAALQAEQVDVPAVIAAIKAEFGL